MKKFIKLLLFLLPTTVFSQDITPYTSPLPKIKANGTIEMPDKSVITIEHFKDKSTTVFFIVRHAEKISSAGDADLNPVGRGRALALAKILKKIKLIKIYSTDRPRTKNTAKAVADAKRQKVELYDAKKQKELLQNLAATHKGQKILLVGHSNTVPQLVNILVGNDNEKEFSEADYSRLYIVSVKNIGEAKVQMIRF